jgi:glycine reductase
LAKEIDRVGLPVVHIATIVPISLTVGANRIVPGVAIPYPLGNPELPKGEEVELRLNIVKKALSALQTDVQKQKVFENDAGS